MTKSDRVRLKDLRAAYRLIGECRELGNDPHAWRTHILEGLRELTGAQVALYLQIHDLGTARERLDELLATGLADPAQQDLWAHYQRERAYLDDPFHLGYFRNFNGSLRTRNLEDVVESRPWCMSRHYNDYLRPCGLYDRITSSVRLAHGPPFASQVLVLHRAAIDRSFPRRSIRLVHLFHHELATLLGRQLAMQPAGANASELPPQLRQVLACALQGDAEKQIGRRLGLSYHTVNRHMHRLYQRFDVHSRGELIYCCRDMLPTLRASEPEPSRCARSEPLD